MRYWTRVVRLHAAGTLYIVGLIGCATLLLGCRQPTDNPIRPERLPRLDIEIDNSATQSDDYVTNTKPKRARIRVRNHAAIKAVVPVTIKNLDFQAAPTLLFASSGTPTSATLDLDLPANGSWSNFVLAGAPGQLSARDKDAVIEVLERRSDGIVLGRKSLMVTNLSPITQRAPRVEIVVGDPEVTDDYLTWRPTRAMARLVGGSSSHVQVVVRNMTPVTAGQLVFGSTPALDTAVLPPAMSSSVSLLLPVSGSWVSFYVAGDFGHPSRDDKDAVMEVMLAGTTQVLAREGVMVRIRKNANVLTTNERDRLLYAIARLNLGIGSYVTYQQIHAVAGGPYNPGHSGPAFLAWHRPYILRYERELQALDPAVALHYWKFDEAAPAVFNSSFMGGPPDAAGLATFDVGNPLAAWTIEAYTGVRRTPLFGPTESPSSPTYGVITEAATLALGGTGATYASFGSMEGNPHGRAHTRVGSGGDWISAVPTAVRDPLFFLLHSNVERLWAKWQWTYARQDPALAASYSPQGAYSSGSGARLGHFEDDLMWPWDGRTGIVQAGDPMTQRPDVAPGGPLPSAIGGWGPPAKPRPRDVIDFDRWTLLGTSGLGYAYDDVPFLY